MSSQSAAIGLAPARSRPASLRPVRIWLYALAVLVALMVGIGGATRLTGSGLSITEWKPVTGAIPPLSAESWDAEFTKYRASSQGQNLNRDITMNEFKFIYAWEWGHRQLGRLIGLVFFLPLAWFWVTRRIGARLGLTLLGIGALGGLQAAVGWIMVASGLEAGMVAVAPIKLMLHLLIASVILSAIIWVAVGLGRRDGRREGGTRMGALGLLALVFVQIALGGLVAGSRAGFTYNTWPLMDGHLVPPADMLFVVKPLVENWVDNPILVQFNHRVVAYALVLFALVHAVRLRWRLPESRAARRATGVAALALSQMALGIATLLLVVPLWAGLAHQLLAMALLAMATVHARLSGAGQAARSSDFARP